MKKPIIATVGAISAGVLALAPLASASADAGSGADRGQVATKVALNPNFTTPGTKVVFKGKVSSKSGKCVAGRTVVLKSKTDGTTYGTDKTDRSGKFKISFNQSTPPPSDGQITATAKEKKVGKVTCAQGSDTETLGV